jgi:branched-chain amino acid transport system ATP-binding protein
MTEPVLALSGLSKSFGALKVTDDVDLDLRPGEIHALIGPNGAGKSSLIKLVAGELAADSGAIRFAMAARSAVSTRWNAPGWGSPALSRSPR